MTEPTPPPPPAPPSDGAPPPPPAGSPPPASPPPSGGSGGGVESENRTVMIVLSYLGILALIPFLVEKEDQDVRWHAKHGLVLFGFEIALMFVYFFLSMVSGGILGCVLAIVMIPVGIGLFVIHIMCIMKGLKGERLRLPVLSDLPDQF